ncbi:class D beta-lactamase [Wukongibacter baidiensis]|uniref:class D beta-lactamase n=1 Tax=Wukongibacter baidiensis TaxID=1723361 RepID=UPI003D7FC059
MIKKISIMFVLILALGGVVAFTNEKSSDIDIKKHFNGYKGVFKLYDIENDKYIIYNEDELTKRTAPASTFKILNSLIALQTGVVEDENALKKWDGKERSIPQWNKDHTLASAVSNSVVWYFQAVARDVGRERMEKYIKSVGYGNQVIGDKIDRFWLDASLKISPNEQFEFVKRLYNEDLPFDRENIQTVKQMLIHEETEDTIFAGKTGTFEENGVNTVGWYVGYAVSKKKPYIFVTRLEKPDSGEGEKIGGVQARSITKEILKELDILK